MLLQPSDPIYPSNRAMAYLKLGKFQDAERDCTTALSLQPTNVKALWRRGIARREIGQVSKAKEDLEIALKVDSNNQSVKEEMDKVNALLKDSKPKTQRAGPHAEIIKKPRKDEATSTAIPVPQEAVTDTFKDSAPDFIVKDSASDSMARDSALLTPVSTRMTPKGPSTPTGGKTFVEGTKRSDTNYFPIASPAAAQLVSDVNSLPQPVPTDVLVPDTSNVTPMPMPDMTSVTSMASPPKALTPHEPVAETTSTVYEGIKKSDTTVIPSSDTPTVPEPILTVAATAATSPPQAFAPTSTPIDAISPQMLPKRTTASLITPMPVGNTQATDTAIIPVVTSPTAALTAPSGFPSLNVSVSPAPPRTALDFESGWKARQNDQNALGSYLRNIPPAHFSTMFRSSLTVEHVVWISKLLQDATFPSAEAFAIMRGLADCQRFAVVAMLMDNDEKAAVRYVLSGAEPSLRDRWGV